jgi:hypothetical protein
VRPDPHRGRDYRPQGLTVVPHDRFGPGGRVNVPRAPIATVAPALVNNGIPATSAPPAPPDRPHRSTDAARWDRNHDGRPDRIETARADQDGFARQRGPGQLHPQPVTVQQQPGTVPMPVPVRPQPVVSPTPHASTAPQQVVSPTPHASTAPQQVVSPTPHVPPTPQPLTSDAPVFDSPAAVPGTLSRQRQEHRGWEERRRDRGGDDWRRDGRDGRDGDDAHRERRPGPAPAPVSTVTPPAPAQPAAVMVAPQAALEARMERSHRFEAERGREAPQRAAPPAPAPVATPAPTPAPAPMARPAPPPPSAPQASAPSRPAAARAEERRSRSDEKRQADR